jgi:hypothetical protein
MNSRTKSPELRAAIKDAQKRGVFSVDCGSGLTEEDLLDILPILGRVSEAQVNLGFDEAPEFRNIPEPSLG